MSEPSAANGNPPSTEEISNILGNIVIPPCPRIVMAMVQESRSDDPDMLKLDKLISGDVGLAASVIKNRQLAVLRTQPQGAGRQIGATGARHPLRDQYRHPARHAQRARHAGQTQ
jgi:hypothetical protein